MRVKTENLICDGCGVTIHQPSYRKNDGSFQETFTTIKGKDMCLTCFGKMSIMYFDANKNHEEILPYLDKIKPLFGRSYVNFTGPTMEVVAKGCSFEEIDE